MSFEKIVIVTRSTRLQELVQRFNTPEQAKFYVVRQVANAPQKVKGRAKDKEYEPQAAIKAAEAEFADYKKEDVAYKDAMSQMVQSLDVGLQIQAIDRSVVPTFIFTEKDIVVTVGQDGLVANTAKYATACPIVAINPDPSRFDGILLPFRPEQAREAVQSVVKGHAKIRSVTLAEASLNDGQRLLAFNDLFMGPKSHTSARYKIEFNGRSELHSSSGLIVSTGAGSTGWLSSIFNMASGVTSFGGGKPSAPKRMDWEDRRLLFVVREPFISKRSSAQVVAGTIESGRDLILESMMPQGGVIFSDGIETDFLEFNSGAVAEIRASDQTAKLVASAAV